MMTTILSRVIFLTLWLVGLVVSSHKAPLRHGRRIGSRFVPASLSSRKISQKDAYLALSPYSMKNVTCHFYKQPLNHFDLPRNKSGTYLQRYCTSEQFLPKNEELRTNAPILFYTGNESPLEQYVEHTGLLWELAEQLSAQVVFAEHRYEGQSLIPPTTPSCMAYSSSVQAITDYARLIKNMLWDNNKRPVICFGGSYGGMLSAWMRMRYPQYVAGAIAASAPIWGFPDTPNNGLDAAYTIIRHGLSLPYPPNKTVDEEENHCPDNLMASFPLISILGQEPQGLEFLTETFHLCQPLQDVNRLLEWLQTPWFDLAEGSFPYPSNYIPFALTHNKSHFLPAWPLQSACWKTGLYQDFGLDISGSVSNVSYTVTLQGNQEGESPSRSTTPLSFSVDWDQTTSNTPVTEWIRQPTVAPLLLAVRSSVAVWYNMSHDLSCFDISEVAPNTFDQGDDDDPTESSISRTKNRVLQASSLESSLADDNDECQRGLETGSWSALCCNEDMNLIITFARGMGRDIFWPPTVPRWVQSYNDYVVYYNMTTHSLDSFCADPSGALGFPQHPDPWSHWLSLQYANSQVLEGTTSNIVFSNGLLDPWSAAGVFLEEDNIWNGTKQQSSHRIMPGLTLQKFPRSVAALLLDHGGHHSDLMFSDPVHDPPAFAAARKIERMYIETWIEDFWEARNNVTMT